MDNKNRAQAKLRASAPEPSDRYRHDKGGEYEVVVCAVQEDTLKPLVVYRSLATGTVWARALENWGEGVDVGGHMAKRFERLAEG